MHWYKIIQVQNSNVLKRTQCLQVQEHAASSALDFIKNNSTNKEMHLKWSTQIVEGMNYLESLR